jgi:hypothetical protein
MDHSSDKTSGAANVDQDNVESDLLNTAFQNKVTINESEKDASGTSAPNVPSSDELVSVDSETEDEYVQQSNNRMRK